MAYLEPEAYSEHCQISTMECFTQKYSYLVHLKKFYIFGKWNFLVLVLKNFLYISGNGNREETSYVFSKESCSYYISGNGSPEKKFFIFQETKRK